ncbi:MAG: hypothetical protein IKS21_00705 [Oscillospiraceae bacterium]|nr:hypothetical protein [Oscillospiraceae bacterium]
MSISKIKTLSLNPHFYSLLMQSFLSGYGKPCELRLAFMSIPILLYSDSRDKLKNANKASRMDTLYNSPLVIREISISGKTRLSGFLERYDYLKPYCKEALIILASEKKLVIKGKNLVLLQKLDYKKFNGNVKEWMRCAFYLGVIFSKATVDHLSYFLGIEA